MLETELISEKCPYCLRKGCKDHSESDLFKFFDKKEFMFLNIDFFYDELLNFSKKIEDELYFDDTYCYVIRFSENLFDKIWYYKFDGKYKATQQFHDLDDRNIRINKLFERFTKKQDFKDPKIRNKPKKWYEK